MGSYFSVSTCADDIGPIGALKPEVAGRVPAPRTLLVESVQIAKPIGDQAPLRFQNVDITELGFGRVDALGVRGGVALAFSRPDGAHPHAVCNAYGTPIEYFDSVQVRMDEELVERDRRTIEGRCVSRVVPDPSGEGFVVGFHRGPDLGIARVDRLGRWSQERILGSHPPPSDENASLSLLVSSILTSSAAMVVVVVEFVLDEQTTRSSGTVHVLDSTTLAPLQPAHDIGGGGHGATWLDERRFLIARPGSQNLIIGSTRDPPLEIPGTAVTRTLLYPLRSQGRRALVSDAGVNKGVLELDVSVRRTSGSSSRAPSNRRP